MRSDPREQIATSSTGGSKGRKPVELFEFPPEARIQLGRVYAIGAAKYGNHNFREGYPVSWSANAMERHWIAFLDGQDEDVDGGGLHLAKIMWHCANMIQTLKDKPAHDDRYKSPARRRGEKAWEMFSKEDEQARATVEPMEPPIFPFTRNRR